MLKQLAEIDRRMIDECDTPMQMVEFLRCHYREALNENATLHSHCDQLEASNARLLERNAYLAEAIETERNHPGTIRRQWEMEKRD